MFNIISPQDHLCFYDKHITSSMVSSHCCYRPIMQVIRWYLLRTLAVVLSGIPVFNITTTEISTFEHSATIFVGKSHYNYVPSWTCFVEAYLDVLLRFGTMYN